MRSPGSTNRYWIPAIAIFLTCLSSYLIFWSGHHYSIDGVVMFQYAKALAFEHSFVMNPPVRWNGSDFIVSRWGIGLTLAYIPILLFLSKTIFLGNPSIKQIPFIPELLMNPELLENSPYRYVSLLNPLLTAATAVLLFLFCVEWGLSTRKSVVIALVFGIVSPAIVFTKFDFAQPMTSFFLLLTFYLLKKAENTHRYLFLILSGTSLGIVILTRFELVLLAPIIFYCAYKMRGTLNNPTLKKHQFITPFLFILPVALFLLLNQYFNYLRFGSWFGSGYNIGTDLQLNPIRMLVALIGNIFSPGRGLLVFFPFGIMVAFSIAQVKKVPIQFSMLLSTVAALFLYSAWRDWGGGISWGPRFLIPFFPLIIFLSFIGFQSLQLPNKIRNIFIGALLIGIGGVVSLQGLLFNFLGFYGQIALPPGTINQGDYNFILKYSPIFAGWQGFGNLNSYDIYWLQHLMPLSAKAVILISSTLILLGILLLYWYKFFRHPSTQN